MSPNTAFIPTNGLLALFCDSHLQTTVGVVIYKFFKDGNLFSESSNDRWIKVPTLDSDTGSYTCIARINDEDTQTSAAHVVTVVGKWKPRVLCIRNLKVIPVLVFCDLLIVENSLSLLHILM